ncbi:MAG: MarR family transcriptional regulator [Hyphomicrobiales bacterium]|nr:MarR family transcriptional regulator [Hyphomicrobiales bacterium]
MSLDNRAAKLRTAPPSARSASAYVVEEQIGFLLRVAMQRHTMLFTSRMSDNITQTQLAVLGKLMEIGSCTQNHLGRLVYLDPVTTMGVVDRLRKRGFVQTSNDPGDRRRRTVSLTDSGFRATRSATKIGTEITKLTLAPLTTRERQTIARLLKKLM